MSVGDWMLRTAVKTQTYLDRLPEEAESSEEGSTTVEYAIGTIATAAFAGLLLAVLKSGGVKALLTNVVSSALAI